MPGDPFAELSRAPFAIEGRRLLLLAGETFSPIESKTAACMLMYRARDAVAVLNARAAGRTAQDVLGYGGAVPVVATLDDALRLRPEVAIVGTAPRGGGLDDAMLDAIVGCLRAGVDVASGLHVWLDEVERVREACRASGARVWDVRRPTRLRRVSTGAGCTSGARTVLTVGSDCNVGKMTVTLELYNAARARGTNAAWAATGQTGMMLRGRGVAVDAVVADFIGGAAEALVDAEGVGADVVFVEGQGSIVHPGYAGVSLGLLYGVMPDAMVLVHDAARATMKRLDVPVPPLTQLIELHEALMTPHRPSRVVAIALNTSALDDAQARRVLSEAEAETGRPAADVIRTGCDRILDAVDVHLRGTP